MAFSEISAHSAYFFNIFHKFDKKFTVLNRYYAKFWPIVTENKTRNDFDQFVSTTMSQNYEFLTIFDKTFIKFCEILKKYHQKR
jgi:hypothetical protein